MTQLYQRDVKVILGNTQIDSLRVQLKVRHDLTKTPNECQLTIYNLSATTRSALQSKGTKVIVEAGYVGTIAQVFSGTSTFIDHVHEGPLWLSKVLCVDGEIPSNAPVKGSFKRGTPVSTVFEQIAKQTGLDVTGATAMVRQQVTEQFTKGYTSFGKGSVEIDNLLKGRGLEWSIQDGRLQVLPEGGTTNDPAILISPSTGLVGSPHHGTPDEAKKKPAVLTVKSLMQPSLRPGRKVQVECTSIPSPGALFRCVSVVHEGDTAGGAWWSEAEVEPIV